MLAKPATNHSVIPFTRKEPDARTIRIDKSYINWKHISQAIYLGITLDSKLLWYTYMGEMAQKATRALIVCRKVVGKTQNGSAKENPENQGQKIF